MATPPPGIPPSSSPHDLQKLERRLGGIDECELDLRAAEAARKDGADLEGGEGRFIGSEENYEGLVGVEGGDGEGGEGEEKRYEGSEGEILIEGEEGEGYEEGEVEGGCEEMEMDADVEMGEDEELTMEGNSEESDKEPSGFSGSFLFHNGSIRRLLSPISEAPEVDDNDNEDADMDDDMDDNAIASSSEEEEEDGGEDDDPSPSFGLHTAPSTRRPPSRTKGKGKTPIYFGALGRAIEPDIPSPALSEASTIILPSSDRTTRSRVLNAADSSSPTPSTGLFAQPISATLSTPTSTRTRTNFQAWRYKDVELPEELPKTMAQWSRLESKVRMVTPLPAVKGAGVVSDAFVDNVRERYGELILREQKRVIEVVKKSKIKGGWDDEWDFLTGIDKKSQQINWDGLSNLALRNIKALLEVLDYEDFADEMDEANDYANPPHSTSTEEYKLVKRRDNYWGIGWSFRGSTGKFSDLTEDESDAYHRELYPERDRANPALVLGIMGDDGRRAGEEVYEEGPVRMQLKDEIKGANSVLGRKPGLLKGGEPGTWPFWVADGDQHLRDWVLVAQGDA
ncbi:hypothetical protein E2P81_ATG05622 [Venturia nashicola]|nr:hypothetical protein E2P81_ATG05622 [Venturia nashicola]